ncbi:MAG: hypothetical protein KTR35_14665 [Gammaproteobacteria bacterium]|nr:hypothetical protein [Gammaproteobacteria bacterium]
MKLTTGSWLLLITLLSFLGLSENSIDDQSRWPKPLGDARLSLIAYATSYQDLYGVNGAGPGHLPCPDTDDTDSPSLPLKAGPNPPCGSGRYAIGLLPSYIQFSDQSYRFLSPADGRLWYVVSSNFINNPVNRLVNLSVADTTLREAVAFLVQLPNSMAQMQAQALLEQVFSQQPLLPMAASRLARYPTVTLYASDFIHSAALRVATWAVRRLSKAGERRCAQQGASCKPYLEQVCADEGSEQNRFSGVGFLIWLTTDLSDSDCEDSLDQIIDNTELSHRHWFLRNRWYESLGLIVDTNCRAAERSHCQFRVLKKYSIDNDKVWIGLSPENAQ